MRSSESTTTTTTTSWSDGMQQLENMEYEKNGSNVEVRMIQLGCDGNWTRKTEVMLEREYEQCEAGAASPGRRTHARLSTVSCRFLRQNFRFVGLRLRGVHPLTFPAGCFSHSSLARRSWTLSRTLHFSSPPNGLSRQLVGVWGAGQWMRLMGMIIEKLTGTIVLQKIRLLLHLPVLSLDVVQRYFQNAIVILLGDLETRHVTSCPELWV
ncbi:hypothetical protein OG21DRAFT_841258 [Imleria badia]|nr:hypothetical protein OG21DRAFT_841258 [Imleria badia]